MTPRRFHRFRAVLDRRQPDLRVLLDGVNKPRNISAILRSCDAVGVQDVYLHGPADRSHRYRRTAGGMLNYVDVHPVADAVTVVQELQATGYRVVAADCGGEAVDFRELDYTGPSCLVMGAELYGVSPGLACLADARVKIPMMGAVASLNVSVAAALLLYEAQSQRERAGLYASRQLEQERYRRLLFEWCYPELVEYYRRYGRRYPEMDEDGYVAEFGLPRGPGDV